MTFFLCILSYSVDYKLASFMLTPLEIRTSKGKNDNNRIVFELLRC